MAPILTYRKLTENQKRLRRNWKLRALALQDTTEYSAGSAVATAGTPIGLLLALTQEP